MNLPAKIKGYRADVINGLIDCIRALTPNKSGDIEPTIEPSGTTYKLKPGSKPFSPTGERQLYMVPVLREWRENTSTHEAEIVPAGEETILDDGETEKNPLVPTWQYDDCPEDFGIKSISGAAVTLYGGEITVGETGHAASDTALTITTDTAYLGWDYSFDSETLSIVNFGETFVRDPAHIRKWLYRFQKYSVTVGETSVDRVRLMRRGRLNDIFPANGG